MKLSDTTGVTHVTAHRVFTGTDDEPLKNGVVTFKGGVIQRISSDTDLSQADMRGEHVHDFGDATVLPGLIDAHAHITLAGDRRTYEEMMTDADDLLALISVRNMELHLRSGVTTLRDNGGRNRVTFNVREAAKRGYIRAPRLLLSGRPVTHTAGHLHWCNGVADGIDEIRREVRKLVAEGADHIKIMASGGGTAGNTPYLASYGTEELRAAVDAAHDLNTPTTAHCRAKSAMVNCLDAGVDCIEHGEFLIEAPMEDFGHGIAGAGTMEYDPAITERMLKAGTRLSFTMQAGGFDTLVELRRLRDDGTKLSPLQSAQREALESYFEMKLNLFADLLRDGMGPQMAVSTDAGPFDGAFGRFHWSMELAVEAGMTPAQAIHAVTNVAADICGIGDLCGSLETGKRADLAVVAGNPLEDIGKMRDVVGVFIDGQPAVTSQVGPEPE